MERDTSTVRRVAHALADRRLFVYAAGLAVITAPRAFASLGVDVSGAVRTVFLVLGLSVMVATYVSELWVGTSSSADDGGDTGSATTAASDETAPSGYSTRDRAVIALAVAGVATGIYITLNVNQLGGILFIGGALFFGQYAFNRDERGTEVSGR